VIITERPPLIQHADGRDTLPYTIFLLKEKSSSEKMEIGTCLLDPSTSCGDFVVHKDVEYKVCRVTFIYKYGSRGAFDVVRKKIDVTQVKSPRFKNALQ
jgi:hypothetical protein